MNPLTNVKNIQKINQRELELGIPHKVSWHQQYKDSAWIFIGGLHYDLTEGDVICIFSQYGEIMAINLIRDKKTGNSKGFAFLCYENQLSTVLSVDNLNGTKVAGRTLRVDHVEEYKVPKMKDDMDEEKLLLFLEGCAPKPIEIKPPPQPPKYIKEEVPDKSRSDRSNSKKKKKKEKKHKRHHSSSSSGSSDESPHRRHVKKKKHSR